MQKREYKINSQSLVVGCIEEAQARYGYGKATIKNIAKEAGAVIRIGRTVRYNFSKIDAYINQLSE